MIFRRKEREDPRPEITPMVDVVFLLIIFFTITTTFTTTGGIDINLPAAHAERTVEQEEKIVINIAAHGEIFVDDRAVNLQTLQAMLKALYGRSEDALVVIQADKDTSHGRVVQVMDTAHRIGLRKIAIATAKELTEETEEEEAE